MEPGKNPLHEALEALEEKGMKVQYRCVVCKSVHKTSLEALNCGLKDLELDPCTSAEVEAKYPDFPAVGRPALACGVMLTENSGVMETAYTLDRIEEACKNAERPSGLLPLVLYGLLQIPIIALTCLAIFVAWRYSPLHEAVLGLLLLGFYTVSAEKRESRRLRKPQLIAEKTAEFMRAGGALSIVLAVSRVLEGMAR